MATSPSASCCPRSTGWPSTGGFPRDSPSSAFPARRSPTMTSAKKCAPAWSSSARTPSSTPTCGRHSRAGSTMCPAISATRASINAWARSWGRSKASATPAATCCSISRRSPASMRRSHRASAGRDWGREAAGGAGDKADADLFLAKKQGQQPDPVPPGGQVPAIRRGKQRCARGEPHLHRAIIRRDQILVTPAQHELQARVIDDMAQHRWLKLPGTEINLRHPLWAQQVLGPPGCPLTRISISRSHHKRWAFSVVHNYHKRYIFPTGTKGKASNMLPTTLQLWRDYGAATVPRPRSSGHLKRYT